MRVHLAPDRGARSVSERIAALLVSAVLGASVPAAADQGIAIRALAALDDEGALAAARAAIEGDPAALAPYLLAADAAFRLGRPDAAREAFVGEALRDTANPIPHLALGIVHRRSDRPIEALEAFAGALARRPAWPMAIREYLRAARAAGRLEQASVALREGVAAGASGSATAYFAQGYADLIADRYGAADEQFTRAIAAGGLPELFVAAAEARAELGKLSQCVELADEGLERAETDSAGGRVRVALLLTRASCRHRRDEFAAARATAEQALALARSLGHLAGEADAMRALGSASNRLGEQELSLKQMQEAIALHERLGEAHGLAQDLILVIHPYNNLYASEGSLAFLRRALGISQREHDRRLEARALGAIGAVLLDKNRHGEALHHLLRALDLNRAIGAKRGEAANATNISLVFVDNGDLERAWEYGSLALRLFQESEARLNETEQIAGLGDICYLRGDLACAAAYHERAIASFRKYGLPFTFGMPLSLGQDLAALGRHEEAIQRYREGLEIAERVGVPRGQAVAHAAIAESHLQMGRCGDAIRHFETALDTIFGEEDEPGIALAAHRGLAACHARAGEVGRALREYREAIRWIESLRREVKLSSVRSVFLAAKREVYAEAVALLFELHGKDPSAGHDREAFGLAEKAKGRALLEALAGAIPAGEPPSKERDRVQALVTRIQARLFRDGLGEAERRRLRRALEAQEERLRGLEVETLKGRAPAAVPSDPEPLRAEQAAALVPEDGVLVEFLLGERASHLFVLSRNEMEFHRIPGRAAIEARVRAFRQHVSRRPRGDAGAAIAAVRREATALFRDLLGPASARLGAARRLVVVPDGVLSYLPFEALLAEPSAAYLAERLELSYAASASVLALLAAERRPAAGTVELLAFGDPQMLGGPGVENEVLGSLERSGYSFSPLPASRSEVESLGRMFGPSAQVFLGGRFRERTVKQELQRSHRYVHFATHAVVDEEVPARSGIVVSRRFDPNAGEDGLLQVHEIAGLRVPAEMVTLSACQTGLGRIVEGEGIVGLARAFQHAGARSLVVSLWNVSDFSTSKFMQALYGHLQAGSSKAAALQAARREMLGQANPWLRHPYFWAAFVLIGPPH